MNRQQVCVHIAGNAADRLAENLPPTLPREVLDAFADADRTLGGVELAHDDTGYDPPPVKDLASLITAATIHAANALWDDATGTRPIAELSDDERFEAVLQVIRGATPLPPLVEPDLYDEVVTTVAQEAVTTFRRRDVARTQ